MKKAARDSILGAGGLMVSMSLFNALVSEPSILSDAMGLAGISAGVIGVLVPVDTIEPSDGPADAR